MAVIPRYISETPVTPSIDQVKMSPGVAAAPYEAAAQSAGQLTGVFQQEMNAWGNVLRQKEEEERKINERNLKVEESLYKAEATANLQVQANQLYQEGLKQVGTSTDFPKQFDQQFQKLADQAILGAPSQAAQLAMTKKLIGMRAEYYNKASNQSMALNNQANMNKMEDMLGRYEGMAAANPAAAQEILKESGDIFEGMASFGIPAVKRQEIQDKFTKKLGYHAVRAEIEADPILVQQKIKAGEYNHLGAGYTEALLNYSKSTQSAYKNQADQDLASLEKRLYSGQPIPENYANLLSKGAKYGLEDKATQINRLLELNKATANSSPTELVSVAAELKQAAADGTLNAEPKQVQSLVNFLEGNAKALQEDGLSYASLKGGMAAPKPVDLLAEDPTSFEERKFRTEQVKAAYSINTPALTKAEITAAVNQLSSVDHNQASVIINNLNLLGQDTVQAVAADLHKKNPGLAVALASGANNSELVAKVVQGKAALASGAAKVQKEQVNVASSEIFAANPGQQKAYIDAAKAIQAYESSKGRSLTLDEAFDEAASVISVDRPGIFTFGKYKTQAPVNGMTSREFESFVDEQLLNDEVWTKFGNGRPAGSDNQPIQWNRVKPSDMSYHALGDGNYVVTYDDHPVMSETGQPLKINLRRLASSK